jgi:intergrase/recombinase
VIAKLRPRVKITTRLRPKIAFIAVDYLVRQELSLTITMNKKITFVDRLLWGGGAKISTVLISL